MKFYTQNAKPLPVLTPQEKITEQSKLRMQFPVSSGTVHRLKEPEWVPVQKTTAITVASVTNTQVTAAATAPTTTSTTAAVPNPTATTDKPQFVPPPPTDPPPPAPEDRVFPEPPTVVSVEVTFSTSCSDSHSYFTPKADAFACRDV